jgi:hypothetical protein
MEALWREAAGRRGEYSAHLWVTILAMLYGTGLRRGGKCMVRRLGASEKWEDRIGLRKCIRPLLEHRLLGQDGMRRALVLFKWSVFEDFFPQQV